MPTDVSFLSASRASRKGDGPLDNGHSKIKVYSATSAALDFPYTNFHGWIRPNEYTLSIPFSTAVNGNVYGVKGPTNPYPPNDDGNSNFEFTLFNAGTNDCHTNQYYGSENYLIASHNHASDSDTYLSDVIWETSIQARVLDSDYTFTGTRPPRIQDDGYTFDIDGSEGAVRCELFLFGVDSTYTPFFSGWNLGTIIDGASTGLSVSSSRGGKTAYSRRRNISGDNWYELKMYVQFDNSNIESLTMRVDVDTPNKTVMFANPVLRPHNISLEKVMGGLGINNDDDFKFSERLA